MHLCGALAIAVGMAVDEDGMRAKCGRGTQGHGGVHAKFAGFVGRRRNYPSLIALSAHDHSLAFQFRREQFFHRHEESVHVDAENGGGESAHGNTGTKRDSILSRWWGLGMGTRSKFINHQGHEVSRRNPLGVVPSSNFVSLVVHAFRNLAGTSSVRYRL